MVGTIKMLDAQKGFGFVGQNGDRRGDVFFHRNVVTNAPFEDLDVGQAVEYEMTVDRRGRPCADFVNVL